MATKFEKGIALLKSMIAPHDDGPEGLEHAWRHCRRCLARHEFEGNKKADDYLRAVVEGQLSHARHQEALKEIVALDLAKDERGHDDFYSGPGRFFRAHAIALAALSSSPPQKET